MSDSVQLIHAAQAIELPPGWSSATIEGLAEKAGVFVDGDWVESKDQDPTGDVRLIQLADIGDGEYRNKSDRFLTHEKALELGCTFLMRDDVLIARMPDPLGRACIFPGDRKKSVTVVDVAIVRSGKGEFNHRWLMYFINAPAFRTSVASLQSGSTRKRISRGNLARISLPVPPRGQQDRIVSEIEKQFSRLDEAVANIKRVKVNLKRYKAAVLKAAVEGNLTEDWRKQHPNTEPASKLLERILAERRTKMRKSMPAELAVTGAAANGWVSVPVGMVCEIVDGDRGSDYPKKSDFHSAGHCLFLSTKNVRSNGFLFKDNQFIGREKHKQLRKGTLERGDIVFTSRGTIGNIAHYGKAIPYECVRINSGMFIIREFSDLLDEQFFEWYLRSAAIRDQIARLKSGTAQPQLPIREFRSFRILFPSRYEQEEVVREVERRLSVIEELEAAVDANLTRADRLRQSVLGTAFTGRLVPQA
jgi:type I restriction enzyme S subunit